jgi:glycine/D-amino acid oxidase-like deaminating enzyme
MKVDYIIVGLGLAGIAFAEELIKNDKSFVVFDDNSQNSSRVAGGMFNPVILKRFTPAWQGVEQIKIALPFYKNLEKKLNCKLIRFIDIKKSFKTIEDQNNWHSACGHPFLKDYLSPKIEKNTNKCIIAPYDLGKVKNVGQIDTTTLLDKYRQHLNKIIINDSFEYSDLKVSKSELKYKHLTTKHIVFCEGYGIKKNPFFKEIPLKEAKGELLEIKSNNLSIDYILKSSVFIMPIAKKTFKIGATFNWKDKTNSITEEGRQELIEKLKKTFNCDYKITNQFAGIRPTVKDRRPLIGTHKTHKNIHLLNGLGTRGVMLAPTLSKKLYQSIENNKEIETEINIIRFY